MTELFEEAIELPPEEVDLFLERNCGEDRDLERAVRELLEADGEAGEFMTHSPYPRPGIAKRVIQLLRDSRVTERYSENNQISGRRSQDLPKEKRNVD